MIHFVLDAAEGATPTGGAMDPIIITGMFVFLVLIWYFAAWRPNKKKEKELNAKIEKMRVGDTVVTIGGLVGKVANIKGDEVTIMTSAANTLVTFKKNAIGSVISRDAKPVEETSEEDKKKPGKMVLKKKEKEEKEETPAEDTAKEDNGLGEIKE